MSDLREIGRQIADAAINAGMAVMGSDFEKHSRLSNKVESLLSELEARDVAIGDSGRVVVDRARFERLLAVAESAYEYTNSPYPSVERDSAELHQTKAVDALHDGDLEPLP